LVLFDVLKYDFIGLDEDDKEEVEAWGAVVVPVVETVVKSDRRRDEAVAPPLLLAPDWVDESFCFDTCKIPPLLLESN
jgi:hypothetical protein